MSLRETSWHGTALTISGGGVFMAFDGAGPATDNQPVQVGLLTEAGVLEIRGRVRSLREIPGTEGAASLKPRLGIAVEFEPLDSTKTRILASLLEGLRERAITVKIVGVLSPTETTTLLPDAVAPGPVTVAPEASQPEAPGAEETDLPERRLVPRVNLAVPLSFEPFEAFPDIGPLKALTVNLGVTGVCLRMDMPPDLLGRRVLVYLPWPEQSVPRAVNEPEKAGDRSVVGEIVWSAPDPTARQDRGGLASSGMFCFGVRFLHPNYESQRRFVALVGHFLASREGLGEEPEPVTVTSGQRECRNAAGQRIDASHDCPEGAGPGTPLVIIAPGFGETKREYVALAYYLASNGFQVLRYDHTNHPGDSDGDAVNATLSGMNQDLGAVIDYAKGMWPTSPIVLVARGLAGRVALKRVSQTTRVDLAILLAGVVDLQATLLAAHQEDLIITFLRGVRRGVLNVLGVNVDADRFLGDAIKEGYSDLRATLRDAEQVAVPVAFFTADRDPWVRLESVKEVQAVLRAKAIDAPHVSVVLPPFRERSRQARALCRQLVACCRERVRLPQGGRMLEPSQRAIGRQIRIEDDRARARHRLTKADAMEFWRDCLDHFQTIANVPEYWQLLDHLYRVAGGLERGGRILDAGCGHGNFGMFLLINQAYHHRKAPVLPTERLRYVGMDFLSSALIQTRLNLAQTAAAIRGKVPAESKPPSVLDASLVCGDLNMPLPFRSHQFDRIICNLVIGHVQDPSYTLGELMRVLSPKGRMVITTLKPHAEFFSIYRGLMQKADRPEVAEEARQLLFVWGKMKRAEGEGVFRAFDQQELAQLLIASGAVPPRIYSTFANQAYLAVVEKPEAMAEIGIVQVSPERILLGEPALDTGGGLPQHRGPAVIPEMRGGMQRVDENLFYRLGATLHPLAEIKTGTSLREVFLPLIQAQTELKSFLNDRTVPLVKSKSAGLKLLAEITKLLRALPKDREPQGQEKELDHGMVFSLTNAIREFETILSAEVQALDAYLVPRKGIYSTPDLIERAEHLLPESVRNNVPGEALADLRQAGRCLAFDIPTAAGIHILRAVEAVIREYYTVVMKTRPKPVSRDWGAYLRALKRSDADPKILAVLEQVRLLHRNPMIHPEEVLTLEEATILLGIAHSAIAAMVMDLDKRKR